MNAEVNYSHLLNKYRTLWNNRLLAGEKEAEQILKEAIAREIKDENSHPRVRKSLHEKFYLAVKRIMESQLSIADKNHLIQIHLDEMNKVQL
ncbi:hypothetical protein J2Z40_001775 [Cytobacillus eiseniae]|uniref:YojE n=1 Tax=Cytobacillus eiseniae TaxID=762947 RepID=A0ABS4RE77_9BACI|nr:hypothetical protein [Cytobacillus eiseniae]MBP2241213.1 hypothetical protein [Cytobacillus eiseniae]